jgi:hypothetical protein
MYNDYALLKFKKFLDSFWIEISYNLMDVEFEEDFYNMVTMPVEGIESYIDKNGIVSEGGLKTGEKIWIFDYNGSPDNSFFRQYSSLEKALIDDMDLNSKTVKDFEEVDSLYGDLLGWLNDKVNMIQYNSEKDIFECDFVRFGDNYNKITFKRAYEKDIQDFYKELKNRLMQTYSMVLEKIPSPTFKPNLQWNKTKVDLVELMAALVESESITKDRVPVSKEYMAEFFSRVFSNMDLTDFAKNLNQTKKRKIEKAPYLKLLVKTFEDYVNKNKKTSK